MILGVIVLASSFCLCVCLALTAERTDIQTLILACRSSGRIYRSSLKVKVTGQRSRSPGQKQFFDHSDTEATMEQVTQMMPTWKL